MIVRGISATGDWLFGKGRNDYKTGNEAVGQNIQTRLKSFLNDCFFATDAGIDWFNLLGNKNQIALNLAVSATILNTADVTGIQQISIFVDTSRVVRIQYNVQTTYSTTLNGDFTYNIGTV